MECGKVKDNVRDTFETRGKYPTSSVCFNEYVVSGKNSSLRLRARVFNNGVAFRYEWTEEVKKAPSLNISEEKPPSPFRKNRSVDPGRLLRPGPLRGGLVSFQNNGFQKRSRQSPQLCPHHADYGGTAGRRRRAHTGSSQLQQEMERH